MRQATHNGALLVVEGVGGEGLIVATSLVPKLKDSPCRTPATGSAKEVFRVFLLMGLTSFGGPIAHIGYFNREFVRRRGWLDDAQFAQLLAVCQILPGPTSSQMGLAIGWFRAGWLGAMAAFAAFTLPSALLMLGFALWMPNVDHHLFEAVIHGLKLVAVAVVAHGVLGMTRQLTPDVSRQLIAIAVAILVIWMSGTWVQWGTIVMGGLAGLLVCRDAKPLPEVVFPIRRGARISGLLIVIFVLGLVAALAFPATAGASASAMAAAAYRAGALVFGGGHVVLPLLHQSTVDAGWLGEEVFLAGYGAAQALPGPMFAFAAFLGAAIPSGLPPVLVACIALVAIFMPGFILLLATLPAWARLPRTRWVSKVVAGINAAVVGLLLAALYDPLFTTGVRTISDFVVVAIGFGLLTVARVHVLWAVLWCVLASMAMLFV